jgi:hypothetical protein
LREAVKVFRATLIECENPFGAAVMTAGEDPVFEVTCADPNGTVVEIKLENEVDQLEQLGFG